MATATKFDASKLIEGKTYPTRSKGGKAVFIRRFKGTGSLGGGEVRLAFFRRYDDGEESLFDTNIYGEQNPLQGESGLDVISDEPWTEPKVPVEVEIVEVWLNLYRNPNGLAYPSPNKYVSRESALANCNDGHNYIGPARLPTTLKVQPK